MDQERISEYVAGALLGVPVASTFVSAWAPLHLVRGDLVSGLACALIPAAGLAVGAIRTRGEPDLRRLVGLALVVYACGLGVGTAAVLWRGVGG